MALILRYVDFRVVVFDLVYGSTGSRRPAVAAASGSLGCEGIARRRKRKRKKKENEKK